MAPSWHAHTPIYTIHKYTSQCWPAKYTLTGARTGCTQPQHMQRYTGSCRTLFVSALAVHCRSLSFCTLHFVHLLRFPVPRSLRLKYVQSVFITYLWNSLFDDKLTDYLCINCLNRYVVMRWEKQREITFLFFQIFQAFSKTEKRDTNFPGFPRMCGKSWHWVLASEIHSHRCMHTQTHAHTCNQPTAHAFVQGKMWLAGREQLSVNCYNSSSQTWVSGWTATMPLCLANYCERTCKSPHFTLCWYKWGGGLLAHLPHIEKQPVLSCFCPQNILVMVSGISAQRCEMLRKDFTGTDRKKANRERVRGDGVHGSTWLLMSFIYSGVTDAAERL